MFSVSSVVNFCLIFVITVESNFDAIALPTAIGAIDRGCASRYTLYSDSYFRPPWLAAKNKQPR